MFNFENEMSNSSSGRKRNRESVSWQSELRYGISGSESKRRQSLGPVPTPKAGEEDKKVPTNDLPKVAKKKWTKSANKEEDLSKPEVRKGDGSSLQPGCGNLKLRKEKKAKGDFSTTSTSQNGIGASNSTDGSKEPCKEKYGRDTDDDEKEDMASLMERFKRLCFDVRKE